MKHFDGPRFRRLFCNDLLQQWRTIWIATLALTGLGLIAYLTNVDIRSLTRPSIYMALFPAALIAGLIFTSTIFADLHHPLKRFHYLTLPCSNFERFLSRYLISAPLLYAYVFVVYAVFDWTASVIANALTGTSALPFTPSHPDIVRFSLAYFVLHAVIFGGAIYFRSYALIKTSLSVVLVAFVLGIAQIASVRIFFWDYFDTLIPLESRAPVELFPLPAAMVAVAQILFCLWVLFIAYQCLREHEVQQREL